MVKLEASKGRPQSRQRTRTTAAMAVVLANSPDEAVMISTSRGHGFLGMVFSR